MKFVLSRILLFQLCLYFIFLLTFIFSQSSPPTVSVNYVPKKQWKMSKLDLADIKLDIERELRAKILQVQMDWDNKQRMEESMAYNQFTPSIPDEYFAPTNPKAEDTAGSHRFYQRESRANQPGDNEEKLKEAKMRELLAKTMDKIKVLKAELRDSHEATDSHIDKIGNNKFNQTVTIDNFVQKYAKHSVQNEFDVFTKIFKSYNSTNMNNVDMNVVNRKIQKFVTVDDKNNLRTNNINKGK